MGNNFSFSQRSDSNLRGVHPDLARLARAALQLSPVDFGVTEGLRTLERQKQLVASGASQTMKSRHITGHAIDVFAYPTNGGSWEWKYYETIAAAFKQASEAMGIPVEWGGDWQTLKDGPHFQLPHASYPA
ncbi:M15 family metallopeptidase [Enterobacter sp. R4-368]|uniref:M15 family metallopeptidase n=1 Tax=Enterobacteriaceae TaxID=543 RepID=UPI00034EFD64|nr:M15 family metallopeptidase [Enterobacter sp. R4-368]AGN83696.1 peptidase M15 [Enterobacter sp. R4-368]